MKKSLLTGKVETIETVEAANLSPKKGVKGARGGGFTDFAEEVAKGTSPKGALKMRPSDFDKKTISPAKKPNKK